jgi:hypothetical protein
MSEPTYGSGQPYEQPGYGAGPGYGQQYGGQQGKHGLPGQVGQAGPYGTGQQPQQPQYVAGYGQQAPGPGGYPSGGYPSTSEPTPSAPRTPADRMALIATVVTVVGYVCAGAGLLGFILWLTVDGDGTYRFATALNTLVLGLGFGGVNVAIGSWLTQKQLTQKQQSGH